MSPPLLLVPLAALPAALGFSGCVSSRYKAAADESPPPMMLNLAKAQPPVEVVLRSVVVYRGPGSWKREAYWDEYMLKISTSGTGPITIDSATLIDGTNSAVEPGDDPWKLEKASLTAMKYNFGLAKNVAVQIGGGVATVVGGAMIGGLISGPGWILPAGVGPGALIAVPVAVGGTYFINASSRREIETEFNRRRLALPKTIEPGKPVYGSLFFRITPGPQRLVLRGRAGEKPVEITFDLAPLAGLHLKTPSAGAR